MKSIPKCVILSFLLLAACGKEKVNFYITAKEEAAPPSQVETAGAGGGEVTWTTPEGWQEQPATAMRQGSFLVTGASGTKADISISGFPGDAGGDLANVNRWRGQIELPPFDEAALQGVARKIELNGESALLVQIDEKADGSGRKIVAVILHREDKTWFVKMTGDAAVVSSQQESFSKFLNTIHFASAGAGPMQQQPASAMPVATGPKPEWKVPAGWQEQAPTTMRIGSFLVIENDAKADVSVVSLGGAAGGRLANVNRWRGQLSLPEMTETSLAAEATQIKVGADTAVMIDMVSASPLAGAKSRTRILGAIIEQGGTTWFVKMTGDDALVEKQKSAFQDFVTSLRIPDHG